MWRPLIILGIALLTPPLASAPATDHEIHVRTMTAGGHPAASAEVFAARTAWPEVWQSLGLTDASGELSAELPAGAPIPIDLVTRHPQWPLFLGDPVTDARRETVLTALPVGEVLLTTGTTRIWSASALLPDHPDLAGEARFEDVVPGSYRLTAWFEQLRVGAGEIIDVDGENVNVTFDTSTWPTLRVHLTQEGELVAHGDIRVAREVAPGVILCHADAFTDRDGLARLMRPPGPHTVEASLDRREINLREDTVLEIDLPAVQWRRHTRPVCAPGSELSP